MAHARCDHRATLLNDGRVLITGGTYLSDDSNRAEIFDPTTGLFRDALRGACEGVLATRDVDVVLARYTGPPAQEAG